MLFSSTLCDFPGGYPNNKGGVEDCIIKSGNSFLEDRDCSSTFNFVCQPRAARHKSAKHATRVKQVVGNLSFTFHIFVCLLQKFHKRPARVGKANAPGKCTEDTYANMENTCALNCFKAAQCVAFYYRSPKSEWHTTRILRIL